MGQRIGKLTLLPVTLLPAIGQLKLLRTVLEWSFKNAEGGAG